MTVATTKQGWLLEIGQRADGWTAWVSDAQRYVVGFGRGGNSRDAVRQALTDAAHHYRKDFDQLTALETAYFGTAGMVGGRLIFSR